MQQTHSSSRCFGEWWSVDKDLVGRFRPDALGSRPGGAWKEWGAAQDITAAHVQGSCGLQAHIWEENHFPSIVNLAAARNVDPWPWIFQKLSDSWLLPSMLLCQRSRRETFWVTHSPAQWVSTATLDTLPHFWASPCCFMLFCLSVVLPCSPTPQGVTENQGAIEPLHWKDLEKFDDTSLPIFSVVSLKENKIAESGTF